MNNIWRRAIVAFFLALAVSGMHWTAAAGTKYEITGYHEGSERERNVNLIIALSLVSTRSAKILNITHRCLVIVFVCCRLFTRLSQTTPSKDA